MPAGTLQQVVVCSAALPIAGAVELRNGGTNTVIYCDAARSMREWRFSAYVIDPASASYIDAIATPYNYAQGGAIWAFGFSFVLGLWFVSRNIGMILDAVRKY